MTKTPSKGQEDDDKGSVIPRGRPKSGRVWKSVRSSRHTDIQKVKPLKSSWNQKMEARKEKKAMKQFENELKEARQAELERKRKKAEAKHKKKLENERKSEVVQVIKDSRKIKKMKKKQLRTVQKR